MNLSRLISILHNQKNSYMNVQLKEFGLSHGQAITLKIILLNFLDNANI